MRHVAEVFGTMEAWQGSRSDPSVFGAAEQERQDASARHKTILENLRMQDKEGVANEHAAQDKIGAMSKHDASNEWLEVVEDTDDSFFCEDPLSYA